MNHKVEYTVWCYLEHLAKLKFQIFNWATAANSKKKKTKSNIGR